jgi:ankyrin repeat protein
LHRSCESGDVDEVKRLLAAGADVNLRTSTSFQDTALHIALEHGHVEIAALLVERRANVDAKNFFR